MLWVMVLSKTNTEDFDNQDLKHLNKLNILATGATSEENNPKNFSMYTRTGNCTLLLSCPCCSFVIFFAVLGQGRNTKKTLYTQLHKKGPALKAA